MNEEICERIRQVRMETSGPRGKAAFARELGVSSSTYDYYERRRVPPVDVLRRIADVARVDIRWLLTGREDTSMMPGGHPAVIRAAELLNDHPECAGALSAFVDLLTAAAAFPADKNASKPLVAEEVPAPQPSRSSRPVARSAGVEGLVAAAVEGEPARPAGVVMGDASDRQGWIPILGRSAAGVPQFWRDAGGDDGGATTLADLVATLAPQDARRVVRTDAIEDLAGRSSRSVQLVLLDGPAAAGTAEFVIAEHLARRYRVLFAMRIDGESMAPEIRHGDVVVLSPEVAAKPGRPAVVQLAGQIGVTCKLIRLDPERVHLIPINESVAPSSHARSELVWALKVIARVRPVS